MRFAPLALLAACSSPASTSTTTRPGDDVYLPIDAAPAITAVAPPDAVAGPCLSAQAGLVSLTETTIEACVDWFEAAPQDCYAITADGAVARPARDKSIDLSALGATFDDLEVEACFFGTCKSFRPSVGKTLHVVAAEMSPDGATVVVVLHNGKGGPAMLELWDFEAAKRTATAEHKVRSAFSYEVEFVGDAALLTATTESDRQYVGSLWSVAGSKLALLSELEGRLGASVALDGDRGVFVLDTRVAVVDLTSGSDVVEVDWRALIGRDPGEDVDLTLAGDDGRFAIAVAATEDGPLLALAVGGADGKPLRYPVAICPP